MLPMLLLCRCSDGAGSGSLRQLHLGCLEPCHAPGFSPCFTNTVAPIVVPRPCQCCAAAVLGRRGRDTHLQTRQQGPALAPWRVAWKYTPEGRMDGTCRLQDQSNVSRADSSEQRKDAAERRRIHYRTDGVAGWMNCDPDVYQLQGGGRGQQREDWPMYHALLLLCAR